MGNLLRLVALVPFGLALSSCAALGPPGSAASSGPSAERPAYKLGDKWIRSDGVFELIRIENNQYVFVGYGTAEVRLSRDLGLAKNQSGGYWVELEPPVPLTWPLRVGKSGQTTGRWRWHDRPDGVPARFTWFVDAYEDVTVAAGTFKAFKIRLEVETWGNQAHFSVAPSSPGWRREMLLWYAPEVRQFVESAAPRDMIPLASFRVIALDTPVVEPLAIRLTEPDDQATSADAETIVAGTVKGGKGVARVVVTVNGAEAFAQPGAGAPGEAVTLRVPVKLKEGKNVILVTATDRSGESRQEARTVVHEVHERLTLPSEGQQVRVTKDKIRLGGAVSGPKGIMWFSVSLNGVEKFVEGNKGALEAAFEVPMTLNEGENLVVVRVTDPGGEVTRQTRVIVLDRSPAPAPAPPPPAIALSPPPAPAPVTPGRPKADPPKPEPVATPKPEPTPPSAAAKPEAPKPTPPSVIAAPPAPKPEPPIVVPPPAKPEPPRPAPPRAEPPKAELPKPVPAVTPKPEPPRPPPVVAPPATVSAPPAVAGPPKPEPPPVPFQVRISSPGDQARFEYDAIALAGLVSGGRGVGRVVVTLNGQEVSRVDERRSAVALNLPVRLREGQNTLVVTATDADGTPYQEVRTVHYEKLIPLTIELRYPEDRAKVIEASTVVVATISSSKGVARVSVTVNGAEVAQPDEIGARDVAVTPRVRRDGVGAGPLQKTVALTVPVTLREGSNVIVVTASEADGTARQAIRTVVYDRPVPLAAAPLPAAPVPAPPKPAPTRWAVIIGVGNYESPGVSKLRYTVNDAEALYEVLTGPAGFKKEHVLLLTDKTEKKPTLRNIKWALGTFLGRSAKKDDTVIVFFAGHGAPEVDTRGLERDGLAKYLVPADADADDLFSTALPMDDLQAIFGRIEAERVVAFLDACYSGAAGGRTFASKRTRASNLDDQFLERITRSKGRAIITASRPSEVSIELDELRHGVFTYYLVEGLRGAADLNRDGIVTLQELYEYVEQRVAQKSRAVGGNQHPIMKGELEGVLPLVRVGR